jgi:hypothetical protein
MGQFITKNKITQKNKTTVCLMTPYEYNNIQNCIDNCDKEIYENIILSVDKKYVLNETLNIYLDCMVLEYNPNNVITFFYYDLNNKIENELNENKTSISFELVKSNFSNKKLKFLEHLILYKYDLRQYYLTVRFFNELIYKVMKSRNQLYITNLIINENYDSFDNKDTKNNIEEIKYYFI